MTPEQLRSFLARSVQRRTIGPSRAAELLANPPAARVLPNTTPIRPLDRATILGALGGKWPGSEVLARRTPGLAEREALGQKLQAQYEAQAKRLAQSLVAGKITVAQWHDLQIRAVTNTMIRQTMIGRGGGIPQASEIPGLDRRIQTQQAFLQRLAETLSAAAIEGKLPNANPAAISNRAALYGGAAQKEERIRV